jgi:3-deoxy-manno-octulosonate cytidylyltransferase (CMP-KDO synthetase)
MDFYIIIPARFASTRFPGKPLVEIEGKSMIQRVYEQAIKVKNIAQVVVATDDDKIYNHVLNFGGKVVITSDQHQSGTDRCNEAANLLSLKKDDVVINIQGDEPFLNPEQIVQLMNCFDNKYIQIATLVKKIENKEEISNPNSPKVVFNKAKKALFFSRSAIPFARNENIETIYHKHIGVYAYQVEVLQKISSLSPSVLEQTEMLEQLRWLENGFDIYVNITTHESIAVDTPADLDKIKKFYFNN